MKVRHGVCAIGGSSASLRGRWEEDDCACEAMLVSFMDEVV